MFPLEQHILRALDGSVRSLARLITRIENSPDEARQIVKQVYHQGGHAHVVGITGPPGSGKSSLVTELAKAIRKRSLTVAIIAVDPTSPFTGGALLGDRVRMRDLSGDKGVFIRSMASRGQLGGLAQATGAVVQLLDAAGYDVILVETVGAGQAEVDIAAAAHTTLVIEAPGMGDDVQSIKAGILEIADILVVNKADRPGVERTVNALRSMLQLGPTGGTRHHGRIVQNHVTLEEQDPDAWQIPVHKTSATTGTGIAELVDLITRHARHLRDTSQWLEREKQRGQKELEVLLFDHFLRRFRSELPVEYEQQIIEAIARRELDPYSAIDQLLAQTNQ
ncbi:MAG: methylmalonyl Co-A mutase-associated GTPase MeaB [Ardenticatenaceae bacterium]|nr:methylmalonyl Co-A mutase-associated GTPase MeaB [Ardenticatenaceae bacterium]